MKQSLNVLLLTTVPLLIKDIHDVHQNVKIPSLPLGIGIISPVLCKFFYRCLLICELAPTTNSLVEQVCCDILFG
jgi:hypothetical protein